MIQRQNSFDALMSLDFQSLQSIDNLANLIQTGGNPNGMPKQGTANETFNLGNNATAQSRQNLAAMGMGVSSNNARRLASVASAGRMESLLRSISNNAVGNNGNGGNNNNSGNGNGGGDGNNNNNSTNNFSNLLQSMQGSLNNLANNNSGDNSGANLQNAQSAIQLANLLRQQNQNDSSTGLTALRMQEGLNQRNSSVDDFLSLVAAGDIPHQDANILNVPLLQQSQQQQQQGNNNNNNNNANNNNNSATQALANMMQNFQGNNNGNNSGGGGDTSSSAIAMAMAQARAAGTKRKVDQIVEQEQGDNNNTSNSNKKRYLANKDIKT